jgi:hypothetical protein
MRPRLISLVSATRWTPKPTTGALQPWPVSMIPATFGVRRTFRRFGEILP